MRLVEDMKEVSKKEIKNGITLEIRKYNLSTVYYARIKDKETLERLKQKYFDYFDKDGRIIFVTLRTYISNDSVNVETMFFLDSRSLVQPKSGYDILVGVGALQGFWIELTKKWEVKK